MTLVASLLLSPVSSVRGWCVQGFAPSAPFLYSWGFLALLCAGVDPMFLWPPGGGGSLHARIWCVCVLADNNMWARLRGEWIGAGRAPGVGLKAPCPCTGGPRARGVMDAHTPTLRTRAVPGTSEVAQQLKSRRLKCDDTCLSLKRASDFGAAVFGATGPPAEVCPYPDDLLVHVFQNQNLVQKCEKLIRAFVVDRNATGAIFGVYAHACVCPTSCVVCELHQRID